MKKSILLIFIAITAILPVVAGNQPANNSQKSSSDLKRYDVKSGMIEYKITINGKIPAGTVAGGGTSSLYFKNYGGIEIREENSTTTTTVSFMGIHKTDKSIIHSMNKLDNGKSYSIDFKNQQISVKDDPMMTIFKKTKTDGMNAGKAILESMGGTKIGEEKYKGYDCEIWEVMGSKEWVYKGVALKIVANVMGVENVTEATSVKFDINVPDSKFTLPNYPIVDLPEYSNNLENDIESDYVKEDLQKLKKLSFDEFKKMIQQNDSTTQNMSDEELRQMYNMMKKMGNIIQ